VRKPDPVEAALDSLSALKANPDRPDAQNQLKRALGSKVSVVVSKAAKLAGELGKEELVPDLVAAFDRFMKDPHKYDKGCRALIEIASALYAMDYAGHEVYLRGIRHVQIEGSFGPPVDNAVPLRAVSALGLVHSRYLDAMEELVRLLADKEVGARIGAVRAIASAGEPASPLLLRLKVLTGDLDADVLGECFSGLLSIAPAKSLPFVAAYLEADEAVSEAAMLAIGATRRADAFDVLKQAWERPLSVALRKTLLLSIATLRLQEALDFLLSTIAEGPQQAAADAISALGLYRGDAKIRMAAEAAVSSRGGKTLSETFRAEFGEF
jgi:HEAT repeat protein